MGTVTELSPRRGRRLDNRDAVLSILGCGRAMMLLEIVDAADRHLGRALTPDEVERAIGELMDRGYPIRRHDDSVATEYWLDPITGGAA